MLISVQSRGWSWTLSNHNSSTEQYETVHLRLLSSLKHTEMFLPTEPLIQCSPGGDPSGLTPPLSQTFCTCGSVCAFGSRENRNGVFVISTFLFRITFFVSWVLFQLLSLQCFTVNAINFIFIFKYHTHLGFHSSRQICSNIID